MSTVLSGGGTQASAHPIEIQGMKYTRHPIHWYEDGNIIFLVEQTIFLLHRGILVRKSTVMADMISLPPASDQPILDGLPVVPLHDSSDEFSNVLDIIYSTHFPHPIFPSHSVTTILGVLRISYKYLMEPVHKWAISLLETQLPVDFESLCHLDVYQNPHTAADVVVLARLCQLPQFLPLALYTLATYDWPGGSAEAEATLRVLTDQDKHRVRTGQRRLADWMLPKVLAMPENGCTEYRCYGSCLMGKTSAWIDPPLRWSRLLHHPLEELQDRAGFQYSCLCESCRITVKARSATLQRETVEQLVDLFDLQP